MLRKEWSGGLIWQMNQVLSFKNVNFSQQKVVEEMKVKIPKIL